MIISPAQQEDKAYRVQLLRDTTWFLEAHERNEKAGNIKMAEIMLKVANQTMELADVYKSRIEKHDYSAEDRIIERARHFRKIEHQPPEEEVNGRTKTKVMDTVLQDVKKYHGTA